jgi:hypothetical protein
MRRAITCLGLAVCVLAGAPSISQAQSAPPIVNRPGATLLLPYFEVDLDNAQGMTTLFSVNNASATAILVHITLWSDLGTPVFAFNTYLTGYDVQTINVRDILNGRPPFTASVGQDFQDTISNQGPLSQDINFASCTNILTVAGSIPRIQPPVDPIYLPYMRNALTGGPSSFHGGRCVSRNLGTPGIARGYITADTVNNCTLRMAGDPGYFIPGGFGDVTNQNVLWGDYQYIDPSTDVAFGDSLVHIVTSGFGAPDPELTTPGEYTFYGRFSNWLAADGREPLATNFATRFVSPKDFKSVAKARRRAVMAPATELVVWRDPKVAPGFSTQTYNCSAAGPSWYPLGHEVVRAFDEQEGTEEIAAPAQLFPAATQRVSLATSALPTSFASGWLFLNLNTVVAAAGANPPEDPAAAQAWVTVLQRVRQGPNGGRYEVGYRALRLDSARSASHFIP